MAATNQLLDELATNKPGGAGDEILRHSPPQIRSDSPESRRLNSMRGLESRERGVEIAAAVRTDDQPARIVARVIAHAVDIQPGRGHERGQCLARWDDAWERDPHEPSGCRRRGEYRSRRTGGPMMAT